MHTETIGHVFADERRLRFTLPASFNAECPVDLFLYVDLQPLHAAKAYVMTDSDVYIGLGRPEPDGQSCHTWKSAFTICGIAYVR